MSGFVLSRKHKTALGALVRPEPVEGSYNRISRRPLSKAEVPSTRGFPLSFAQERAWFMDRLFPGSPLYNLNCDWRFTYAVDIGTLRRSVNEIVRRHESLRTTFSAIDGEPIQIVASSLTLAVPVVNLHGLSGPEREATALRLANEEAQRPFDLERGPLVRTTLLSMGGDEYIFLLTVHHIISDGWSLGVFWDELLTIWTAFDRGEPSPLPVLSIQYVDFAVWQRNWLTGKVLASQIAYWKNQLSGLTQLQLCADHPRPAAQTANGSTSALALGPSLSSALKAFGREQGATLFMTLLAGFQSLLFRYTGQDDVAVGTFIANRTRAETEPLIGFFVNTLVLRSDFSGTPSFRELLRQVRRTTVDAYVHQDLPFAKLVQELQPERDLSRNPLFQVAFQLLNLPDVREGDGDSDARMLGVQRGTAILDITLSIWESTDGLAGEIEYNRDLFDAGTIDRMAAHFRNLLLDAVRHPDVAIHELALLDDDERRQLLVDWNATGAEYPREASLVSLFEAQVARGPGVTALVCEGQRSSYAELNRRANQLARHLRGLGVGLETRVGICMDRSIDMVIGLLAILKAGGAYVPLDPAYPADRLAYMVNDAGLEVLLSQQRLVGRLPRGGARVVCRENWDAAAGEDGANLGVAIAPENLAYVIYTSGSTGRPKGVLAMHRGAVNRFAWMWEAYPFEAGEVCCARTSLSFVDSVWEIFGPLLGGIRTVIIPEEKLRDVAQLVATLAQNGVTRLVLVPSLLVAMLDSFDDLGARLRALKYWITSGEALSAELARRFRERIPHGILINLYGSSEVAGDVTCFDLGKATPTHGIPIGRPIANTQTYIVDRDLRPVPVGVPGELLVGGEGLSRGYHNLPELTAEKFIANPFDSRAAARLYRTGDLARYLPDSQIEFLGRRDRQVKIRGFRIELGEIEAVLSRHPSVKNAIVMAREDGTGGPRLVAYIVRSSDYDGSELRNGASSWSERRTRQWQEVWEQIYDETPVPADPALHLGGWNSSYTGLPIPVDEMREWVDRAVERVRSLAPSSVLDIGCGAGLLLLRLAQSCDRYCGTDFSAGALRYVRAQLRALNLCNVSLLHRPADDFTGLEPESFDVVVLNSVVQYFPDIDYLVAVLGGAIRVVRPGGAIYLGAVRSLPLLEAFHTSVELQRASALLPIGQLRRRICKRLSEEEELVIDPAFFFAIQRHFPQISQVLIEPKRGRFQNELTRFRYEVVLHVNFPPHQTGIGDWLEWRRGWMSMPAIRQELREGKYETLRIARIPNGRLTSERKALELLASLREEDTVRDLRDALGAFRDNGVDPEELWDLQGIVPYSVQLHWSGVAADDCFDALICKRKLGSTLAEEPTRPTFRAESGGRRSWSDYASNPLQRVLPEVLVPELRRFVRAALPEHMAPATFVWLDSLPLTPSGKVDHTALPALDAARPERKTAYLAPRTRTERVLAGACIQLLGVDRVGADDNFFQLGGHSLLAIRLLSRVREAFQVELPLRAVFESPTVAGLAQLVEEMLSRGAETNRPIRRRGS